MDAAEVVARVTQALPDAAVDVEGADCNFSLTVISAGFEGLVPVKRQQKVLDAFADVLASGALHALTLKVFTPREWDAKNSALVQIS